MAPPSQPELKTIPAQDVTAGTYQWTLPITHQQDLSVSGIKYHCKLCAWDCQLLPSEEIWTGKLPKWPTCSYTPRSHHVTLIEIEWLYGVQLERKLDNVFWKKPVGWNAADKASPSRKVINIVHILKYLKKQAGNNLFLSFAAQHQNIIFGFLLPLLLIIPMPMDLLMLERKAKGCL